MIILAEETIREHLGELNTKRCIPLSFAMIDDGEVYAVRSLNDFDVRIQRLVKGVLRIDDTDLQWEMPDGVEVVVEVQLPINMRKLTPDTVHEAEFRASVTAGNGENAGYHSVQIIPIQEQMFSRTYGIYETEVLKEKTVLVVGLGSGGSLVAVELAKAGVGSFILVDPDRLEIVNIVRHVCGISDLGRFKTKAVRDQILDKNPFAYVETYEQEFDWDQLSDLQELVGRADLVFCCTDSRQSRLITNIACIKQSRSCIYGGVFRRAYGGQVLRVIPGKSMCYQCFISSFGYMARDEEIATTDHAERIAYSDRPVPVEPGLSTDIAPVAIMCLKLGILEMLRGTNTTLKSLYDDLSSPLYQWLNRREVGTDYEVLRPLDSEESGLRILAWYGIDADRNPGCSVCGDFVGTQAEITGVRPTKEQIAAFDISPDIPCDDEAHQFPPDDVA